MCGMPVSPDSLLALALVGSRLATTADFLGELSEFE